jgi:hypothetical protein
MDVARVEPRPGSVTGLTGAAGEYHVAAELSRRGWLATVTIKNAPGTDVLAQDLVTGQMVSIQVKTASPGNDLQLSAKAEAATAERNAWFVMVQLGALDVRPNFFVVPRNVVAACLFAEHTWWVRTPGEKARPGRTAPTGRCGSGG